MRSFQITLEGLESLVDIENLPDRIKLKARQAVNKTLDRARTRAAAELTNQIAFPVGYLRGANRRLWVSRYASESRLEGALAARIRPTSLARFVQGSKVPFKRGGTTVAVHPYKARYMKRAFLIKLRAGRELTEENFNLGLAVRVPAGKKPDKAYKPAPLGRGLWLLYGPSVQQAFIGQNPEKGVAQQIKPDLARFLSAEFERLLALDRRS